MPGYEKSRHFWRQVTTSGHFVQKWDLYIGVRVIHIVIVEDVLVLAYGPCVCPICLVHLASLVQPRPPAAVDELIEGKGVFHFIGLSRVFVVGVLFQIVLWGIERGQAPKL